MSGMGWLSKVIGLLRATSVPITSRKAWNTHKYGIFQVQQMIITDIWLIVRCSKKTTENSVFLRQNMGITSLWEDLEAKLLTPGQLLGNPWKVWGITVQTCYWEGRWHQNWVRSRLTNFLPKWNGNSWKTEIFYSSASSSKTKRDIGMGPTGEMLLTYRATNALLTNSGCGAVLTVFCLPEVGRCR